ncbi:MAG: hypothetical protein JRD89_18835 [Deltaproteobacteria bacterium]|nr:hypothetical protein [Deltaproteobacteria bacterium]
MEARKAEELRKSVKIGRTVYDVAVDSETVIAGETTYPMPGYGNNYGTEYVIHLTKSKRWAKKLVNCWNNTYATRGHGMTDYWTDYESFVERKEAEGLISEVKARLEQAEDSTPDIKEIFDLIVSKFEPEETA